MLILLAATLASAQRFIRPAIYSAGNPSIRVVSGDFNHDGNTDLAFLSNTDPGVITIRLGIGNGKFNAGQQIALSDFGASIITGDWNGDGVLDLAATVASAATNEISILLGNGDGTFALQQSYDIRTPGDMATGDVNGDGVADIVSVNVSESASVLSGVGDGTFRHAGQVDLGYPEALSVALADMNLDGKLDMLTVNDDSFDGVSNLSILLGKGDGTFGSPSDYATDYYAGGNPAVADFNHDGIPDVAALAQTVSVYLGRGDGTLAPPTFYSGVTYGSGDGFVVADINNDGNVDLVSPTGYANSMSVFLGNRDGSFKAPSAFGTGPSPYSVAIADFNKDGKPDAAVPDSTDSNFVELVGDGTGKFVTHRSFSIGGNPGAPPIPSVVSVASGYFDADANLDLAVIDNNNSKLVLLPGNKNGAFRLGSSYSVSGQPTWVTAADLNADSKADLATADKVSNTVSVFLGNGNGTLQSEATYSTGANPAFIAAADVNGDGKIDLLTASTTSNTFSVLLASGSGYLPHVDYTVSSPVKLASGDFNADGKLDLVVAGSKGTGTIFLGNGDGTFSAGATLKVGSAATSAAVGDLNKDGKLDVVMTSGSASLVYSFLGNGDGTFRAALTSTAPASATQVLLADFDSDGKLDAMLIEGTDAATASAALLPGKGDGTFRQAQLYTLDSAPLAEAIGDLNNDGWLDVATANGLASNVSVLLNTGAR
ncbi:MAG: VCBS repeat-containing protein [Acidobacteriales bacterium]|nr:VCBS repeat-containing protein [Terriglobales bacterium]